VLLKIVCLLMRWLFGLTVLVFRGDRSKNAELLVLRQENAVLRRTAGRVRYEPADRVHRAYRVHPAAALSGGLPRDACNAAGLAPQARRQEIRHQQAAPAWPPGDGSEHRAAGRPPGAREPGVGLPAYAR
jgi:hypothetical protein